MNPLILMLFVVTTMLLLMTDKFSFAFAMVGNSTRKKRKITLRSLANKLLSIVPLIAAAAEGGGGAAAAGGGTAGGGAMGMLSKFGGMGGGGGGASGGGGGGGTISSLINAGNKPLKATLGLATGLIQGISAMKAKRRAEAAFPELVDPNQAAYLAELKQKARSVETGADFAEGMKSADQTNASVDNSLVQNSGGDVGGTIQGLLQAQAVTDNSKDNILAQGQSKQFNYDSALGSQLNMIADRKMELQLLRSAQARAEWDRKSRLASANLMAGLTSLAPGGNSKNQPAINAATDGSAPSAMAPNISSLAGKPASSPMQVDTTGVQSPKVVPQTPDIPQTTGVPINLQR